MGDSYANLLMVGFIALLIFLYFVFPHIFYSLTEKITGSTHDARLKSEGKGQVFMQSGRLADRYAGILFDNNSLNISTAENNPEIPANINAPMASTPSETQITRAELNFCPYCGADMSGMDKDDMFCTNCGAKLR